MHCQFAVLRDKRGRQILDAHTRTSRDDDDVCVSMKGIQNGVVIIAMLLIYGRGRKHSE